MIYNIIQIIYFSAIFTILLLLFLFFFFNDTATTEIYTLSLHDALPLPERPLPSDLATLDVEPLFAERRPAPELERPFPSARRAIFFDVENTSRAEHIARVIEHLGIDRQSLRTDFVAVGNWRVIGHDTARL